MVVAVWSVKGGVGVSSVASLLAIGQVERAADTLLVDLGGDLPALLGLDDHDDGPGVAEWCAADAPTAAALARLELQARHGLQVIPRGGGQLGHDPTQLADVLRTSRRQVIVDCGVITERGDFARQMVEQSDTSLLVVRACYLNLRAAKAASLTPTGVVVITEAGRALGRGDIEAVAGAPVVSEVSLDRAIARSLDVGLARARLPRPLVRAMGKVLPDAA